MSRDRQTKWQAFKDRFELPILIICNTCLAACVMLVVCFAIANFTAVASSFIGSLLAIIVAIQFLYHNVGNISHGKDHKEGGLLFELSIWAWDRHIIRMRRGEARERRWREQQEKQSVTDN